MTSLAGESHPNGIQASATHREGCGQPSEVVSKHKSKKIQSQPCSPPLTPLPVTRNEPVIKLIGKKALIQCILNGLAVTALLDTGAQVSIIDRSWKDKYLPKVEMRPFSELLGVDEMLEVYAISGDRILFDGWVAIAVNLPGNTEPSLSIIVPFLVSHVVIEKPLLGFDVLEELIQGQPERLIPTLVSLLSGAVAITNTDAKTIVQAVQAKELTIP